MKVNFKNNIELNIEWSYILNGQEIIENNPNVEIFEQQDYITVKRTFTNNDNHSVKLNELKARITGLNFGLLEEDDYFYHNENPRIYENFTFPIDFNRMEVDVPNGEFDPIANNKWADAGVVRERIGASPYQPFPAILVSNYKTNLGLVHGTLNQDVFYHNYLLKHNNVIQFDVFSSFKNTAYRIIKPNETIVDEWYLGFTDNSNDIEQIFSGFLDVLRKRLKNDNACRKNVNRYSLIWGSWNDGGWRDITESSLCKEALALKKYFPTVKWLQLDDGYATYNAKAHGLGVPYEGEDGIDKNKFPNGLKSYAEKIKEIGLRPSIWIGGFCPIDTKIYKEHKEWFLDYSRRSQDMHPLDVSQKEVRDYMTNALDDLISKNGFEGVKHDFWSYAFEDSDDLYLEKDKSGYEYRSWWSNEISKRLPKDGYLQTGCDLAMANPFLSKYFTNYRYGIDIGEGNWDNIKTILMWGSACFATHIGDMFIPNSDAIGIFKRLPDNIFKFWVNYVLITRSMVELSGNYSNESELNLDRLKILQKATCNVNNGQDVHFLEFDYRILGKNVPEIFYIDSAYFANDDKNKILPVKTIALFNSSNEDKNYHIDLSKLGLKDAILTDVWSGEQYTVNGGIDLETEKCSSRLFTVNEINEVMIYDSNIQILSVNLRDNVLSIDVPYSNDVELLLNKKASKCLFNGKDMLYNYDKGKLTLKCKSGGILQIYLED